MPSLFTPYPLQITGPSYQSRSLPVSAQRTVNMYPRPDPSGISDFVLYPWPGLKPFHTATYAGDGGMTVFNNTLYRVANTDGTGRLASVPADGGTETVHGTSFAMTGMPRSGIAVEPGRMLLTTGTTMRHWDGTTLSAVASLSSGLGRTAAYINSKFVVGGSDNIFHVDDVGAGAPTFTSGNSASPENDPDDLVAVYSFNQILYLFGRNSIEPWEDTGSGTPPFERIDGGIVEDVGTTAEAGITSTPRFMYFVSARGEPYRVSAFEAQPIGTPPVSRSINDCTLSTMRAYSIELDSQWFIVFAFEECTWVYAEDVDAWFELEDQGGRWLAGSYAHVYGKHLLCDWTTGNTYELDFDTRTNNGNTIIRERTMATLAGEHFGRPGALGEMSKLRFSLETGIGLASGQGSDPQMMVQLSTDGGKTWGQEYWLKIGRQGELAVVELHKMLQFRQLVIRLRMSDPVPWTLYSAGIDLRSAGE